ncbi:hypothetical protein AAFP30_04050 [Gordonia sp. CPCC 205515]|uniref:hypothetical protein n=1 Tax=Gordonia sp. CPCC 205515 TaxID=3140791 RepID=UPI003AF3AE7A
MSSPQQPAHPPVSPHVEWQPGVGAPPQGPQPEYWLTPGPMLRQRTWQRSSRTPVMIVSIIGVVALLVIGLAALLFGSVSRAYFTAHGVVVCSTLPAQATALATGAPVLIYDEGGERLADTRLGQRRNGEDGQCELPFSAKAVRAGKSGYVVRIGNVYQETVSGSALESGVVLRPLG